MGAWALSALQLSAMADRVLPFKQFCRTGLWTRLYRALRDAECRRVGKDPDPSAAIIDIIDAQSVKTVEESGCIRGCDAHNTHTWIKGRKRHLLVDTLSLPLSVYVSSAGMHDTQGARRLLARLKYVVPRLKKIWADAAYCGQELSDWRKAVGDCEFAGAPRTSPGIREFSVHPKRWVTVGRGTDLIMALAWLSRNRRMSKD